MWVKICGNTRLEDCLLAADLGADAVGFVFAASPRMVSEAEVANITARLPSGLEKIGVFNTGSPAAIAWATEKAKLSGVQLHSAYNPHIIRRVGEYLDGRSHPRVLQVVSWRVDQPAEQQTHAVTATLRTIEEDGLVDAVLLDSSTAGASGGTGEVFDWTAVARVLQAVHLPVIVAGGLTPANVGEATRTLMPAGVDVSSSVEDAPGIKNASAMAAFLSHAKG